MDCQKEKIMGFSKVFHIVLVITGILTAVLGLMKIFAYVWSTAGFYGEEVIIDGALVTLPSFLSIGRVNIFYWSTIEMGALGFGLEASLRIVVLVISLFIAERMFMHLKNGASPFSEEVISWFKRFAFAVLIFNFATNVISIIVPIILIVIGHIFDYGRTLQEESDTTL